MTTFEFGPDKGNDLRTDRPYFMIPLLCLDPDQSADHYRDRVADYIQEKRITDVYVLSHGWHRNLFSGVGAYDRLVSRFGALFQRGRLIPKDTPYQPLFLAMHWNSDPAEDGWVDTAGRRDKKDFLANAMAVFEPASGASAGAVQNTLEDLYEFMTYLSAPDVEALSHEMDTKAAALSGALAQQCEVRGRLAGGPPTTSGQRAALIWRCYQEAAPQRVLLDQSEGPKAFGNPLNAVANLLKFLIAAVGLFTLLGLLAQLFRAFHPWPFLLTALQKGMAWLQMQPVSGPVLAWFAPRFWEIKALAVILGLTLIALGILAGTVFWQQVLRPGKGARGLPVLAVGSWLPLQLLFTLPLLIYLFATFLFRTPLGLLAPVVYALSPVWHGTRFWPLAAFLALCAAFSFLAGAFDLSVASLFDERLPRRSDGTFGPTVPRVRDALAWFAQRPLRLFQRAVAFDSQSLGPALALEKQLAFWEMQRKGVQAGQQAGQFLDGLVRQLEERDSPALTGARFHLIGHSFGGLVVANMARYLAQVVRPIRSLILLEAALGSAWFAREPWCRDGGFLQSTLACVYSAYDMANGFYYPAANDGRMAAGYVGLCEVGKRRGQALCLGKDGLFASLSQPPTLAVRGNAPYALNLDASRLIYEGSPAAGGGHDDVYKDDVIHMLWAITQL